MNGRRHRLDHVFSIAWCPSYEGMHKTAQFPSLPALVLRSESKTFEDITDIFSSAAWCGPLRGYVFLRSDRGIGYYKQGVSSRDETSRQRVVRCSCRLIRTFRL